MLKMRLQRVGRRNDPLFRVVLTESRNPAKGGKCIEVLGSYNPHTNTNQIDTERVNYWLSQGVKPSDTVHNLLINEKVIEGKKVNVLPKKQPIVKEADEEESKEAAAPQPTEEAATAEGDSEAAPESAESSDEEAEKPKESEAEESASEKDDAPTETTAQESSEEEKKEQ